MSSAIHPASVSHGDQTVRELCGAVASADVTPAGGTTTAVVGALGASLCEMACIHAPQTVSLETADVSARARLAARRERLLVLGDADAGVVDELFGGDGDTTTEKRAVGVPLTIAEACLDVLTAGEQVVAVVDSPVVADAGTGLYLTHGALRAAVFTVRGNVAMVEDQAFAMTTTERILELETAAEETFERALAHVD